MRSEYVSRINRVIDYVDAHIDDDFSLKTLSEIACFSPYHFHRIFKAVTGETLHQFTKRLRIEKAAMQLINLPEKSITDIALHCGFSGSAAFSRSFRSIFQMSPSQWRKEHCLKKSKNCKTKSNKWKVFDITSYYIDSEANTPTWEIQLKNKQPVKIEIKNMPDFYVAYIRQTGLDQGDYCNFLQPPLCLFIMILRILPLKII